MANKFFTMGPPLRSSNPPEAQEALKADISSAADAAMAELDAENHKNSEVEHRLEKALAYQQVINEPYFGDNPSQAQMEVEDEIAAFAQMRLHKFLGMAPPEAQEPTPSTSAMEFPFDEQQTQALGMWANKLLKRDASEAIVVRPPTPPAPVTTSQPSPPAPATVARPTPAPVALARRRPGRPPGTGKHQRAQQAPEAVTKSEAAPEALPELPPDLPPNVTRDAKGKLWQTVQLTVEGEVVEKKVAYQVPVKSLVTPPVPMPTEQQMETCAPVTTMRMSAGMGFNASPNSMPPQVLESLKSAFMK